MLASEDKLLFTTCITEESGDLVAFQLHVTTPVANLMVSYSPKTHYFFFLTLCRLQRLGPLLFASLRVSSLILQLCAVSRVVPCLVSELCEMLKGCFTWWLLRAVGLF